MENILSEHVDTSEDQKGESSLEDKKNVRFQSLFSCLDPSFWYKVTQLKLEVDKLSEVSRPLIGFYYSKSDPFISLDCSSFNQEINKTSTNYIARGYCINKNTLDSFKNCDKNELLKKFGEQLLTDFRSGKAVSDPSLIPAFNILMYSDLKRYHFYYWFAFPTFAEPMYYLTDLPRPLNNVFLPSQIDCLIPKFQSLQVNQRGFFGIMPKKDGDVEVFTLEKYIELKNALENQSQYYLVFADPSDLKNNPGWPLRNVLFLLLLHCPSALNSTLKVIALRGTTQNKFNKSIMFSIKVQSNFEMALVQDIKYVGWEKNDKGKFCPKYVDLSKTMDSKKHARESVDLNLKLMKWRLAPDLNLDVVAKSKCLVIGAGTLGCCVARNLMSWGVRNITLIDNGKVSYSNPVRQSLYKHSHCVDSNTYKALAAADVLKEIHPEINSNGVVINIPMPGHEVNSEGLQDVDRLSKLIQYHDVIFLLTDSRESRWLPTMLSTLHDKLAVTAALGFDSYLVIRHGTKSSLSGTTKLGCYFCNDVTAPGNSFADKTLDQQCTVTRPGVSAIAGALAVELFVSYAQLKDDISANANSCIGVVPHSIRGFLCDYQQITPFTPNFDKCIACSSKVINNFINSRDEFLSNVFTNPNYLEDLTGLTELKNQFEKLEIFEVDEFDI